VKGGRGPAPVTVLWPCLDRAGKIRRKVYTPDYDQHEICTPSLPYRVTLRKVRPTK